MTKLDQLNAEKGRKFDEICALLARELGYGDFTRIDPEGRKYVEHHAKQQVDDWEETTELRLRPGIRPNSPLRRLLNQYRHICERILDEQDLEIGLWAYKKRKTKRQPASH